MRTLVTVALVGLVLATPAAAQERLVQVPLRFDFRFLRELLLEQLYTGPDASALVWDDGQGCGHFSLRDPSVTGTGERVRIVSRGSARLGRKLGGFCIAPLQWEGFLEVLEVPELTEDGLGIRFRIVDSNIYDLQWKKRFLSGRLWDLVKDRVVPSLEAVRIDLRSSIDDLRELLPLLVRATDRERSEQMVSSLRFTAVAAGESEVTALLAFEVPAPLAAAAPPQPEPTLSPGELTAWETTLDRWDAFLTFVIKQVAHDDTAAAVRAALRDVLLESRYELLDALAPATPLTTDPTPELFVHAWERLAPVVRQVAGEVPGTTALRYLSFIASADALAALQQAGPGTGVEISADGLRRLARIVAPTSPEDPLAYSLDVDPELRTLFGFGPPLPPPDLTDEPAEPAAWWWRWVLPRTAYAESGGSPTRPPEKWLFDPDRVDDYLDAVRAVLQTAADTNLQAGDLSAAHRDVYDRLVPATAWQESCWRQFVREGGRITYIRSQAGAAGLMQVNERVWRGMYDARGLRWDIRYNARAGAEILMHYLVDYAIAAKEDQRPGGIDNLARSTYAMYNGGPRQRARYRAAGASAGLKRIDRLFWEKYEAIRDGRESAISQCLVGG
jgi:hypothetical protein